MRSAIYRSRLRQRESKTAFENAALRSSVFGSFRGASAEKLLHPFLVVLVVASTARSLPRLGNYELKQASAGLPPLFHDCGATRVELTFCMFLVVLILASAQLQ